MNAFPSRLPAVLAVLLLVRTAGAQIEVSSTLEHNVYLQFEPVVAVATVKSSIGQPVVYNGGPEGPNFYFRVNDEYGNQLPPLPDVKPPEPLLVPAQVTLSFTNNLLQRYNLARPGFYSVQPCVDWMGKTHYGEKKHIEIVTGLEILRVTGKVPADGTSRTFMIKRINRLQQDHLLLRIDDEAANLCYGVFNLGRAVMNEKPRVVLDAKGNAHILFKNSPYQSSHLTYNPFGSLVDRKDYGNDYNTLSLKVQSDGSVSSSGSREGPAAPKPIDSILSK